MYKLEFLKEAYEEFKRLDKSTQRLIKDKLEILIRNPKALKNNIRRLKGKYSSLFRLRVGNYRIIYKMDEEKLLIIVVRVGHRGKIY